MGISLKEPPQLKIKYIIGFEELYHARRYKIFHGGRGAAKSWEFARALIGKAYSHPTGLLILCARQFQNSISDSVHRLLAIQIEKMGLSAFFEITKNSIKCKLNDSEFIFKGIQRSIGEIKSTEGIDILWVEEADAVSEADWVILVNTIRKKGSEIWVSFNPNDINDPTYQRFVVNPQPNSFVAQVNYPDNPYFADTELQAEMEYCKATDFEAYQHIWEGNPKTIGDAVIFRKKIRSYNFDTPEDARFFHGADWGFSEDPTALVRLYIQDNVLFIDQEQFGHHVDLDDTPALFDNIKTSRAWPIKADCSRPETISYMAKARDGKPGFKISGAKKWAGSVEDGIAHLRSFKYIVIHPRCKHMLDEARLYQYKVDRKTGDILPIIVDKHNHGWDAVRYALDGYITNKGNMKKVKLGGL